MSNQYYLNLSHAQMMATMLLGPVENAADFFKKNPNVSSYTQHFKDDEEHDNFCMIKRCIAEKETGYVKPVDNPKSPTLFADLSLNFKIPADIPENEMLAVEMDMGCTKDEANTNYSSPQKIKDVSRVYLYRLLGDQIQWIENINAV